MASPPKLKQTGIRDLPNELYLLVVENVTNPSDLLSVALTCKHYWRLSEPAFSCWYGHEVLHDTRCSISRKLSGEAYDVFWKWAALDKHQLMEDTTEVLNPSQIISSILKGNCASRELIYEADLPHFIVLLHQFAPTTPKYLEAIAAVLVAAGRHEEAIKFYHKIVETQGMLPEYTHIIFARFGAPSGLAWPAVHTKRIRDRGLYGAVLAGNLKMVSKLRSEGADLHAIIFGPGDPNEPEDLEDDYTIAFPAVESGSVEIVQYMERESVDCFGEAVLDFAFQTKSTEVVKYLMGAGADLDVVCGLAEKWKVPDIINLCLGQVQGPAIAVSTSVAPI